MKLTIHEDVIVRIPQFHLNARLEDHWDDLRDSIKISSPEFYQIIKDVSASEIGSLPKSVYHSVWKYFNRAKYRATPYGSFAGFGIVKNNSLISDDSILVDSRQILYKNICWTKHKDYSYVSLITDMTILFTNSSYYRINDKFRYLLSTEDGNFDLGEIDFEDTILELLEDCRAPISVYTLKQKANWIEKKIEYINQLVALQLLLTSFTPNIIGKDYFKRLGVKNRSEYPQYIIAERKIESGALNNAVFKNIAGMIGLMEKLVRKFKSPALEKFKNEFKSRFENRYIPLMQALDPEIGISFVGNEESSIENEFIASFATSNNNTQRENEHVLETLLLNSGFGNNNNPVDLECIGQLFKSGEGIIPNTLSMLCSIVDDQLILEHIGGATAISVLGRYSLSSEAIEKLCCSLAKGEQKANPEVLFFDIAYISEPVADNINRRKTIYTYQLSILNFDMSLDPLTIEDLSVCIESDEIMLYSKRHKKRMVPRLTTAYNYNRSDLPLFRFLCELQYQGLKSNLGFYLSDLIPNQDYYPRIVYKNIIISPAKWKVTQDAFLTHQGSTAINNVAHYIRQFTENQFIQIRTDDRTMCFDTGSEIDMNEFSFILKKYNSFYIEECFMAKNPIIKDDNGNFYGNQFVITFLHQNSIYQPLKLQYEDSLNQIKRNFAAGTEWLYYDIYVHPFRSDYLLQDKIASFLRKYRSKIGCWFFMRYNKDGSHLRLRMKLKDVKNLGTIIVAMADLLESELDSGLISEFKISRYQRELERYSVELMEHTENLFFKDSTYVVSLLAKRIADAEKYKIIISFILRFREHNSMKREIFDDMLERSSEYFLQEHEIKTDGFKRLNYQYKQFKELGAVILPAKVSKELRNFETTFINLLTECREDRRPKLFTDLIHMHINRMFSDFQRTHEMVIYYFLVKTIIQEKAIIKMHAVST